MSRRVGLRGMSFCVGVYNESGVLATNVGRIDRALFRILRNRRYEIVVVENGSTDGTAEVLRNVGGARVKKIYLERKGHGRAYREAIKNAKYDRVVLTAIDLPFGFDDLEQALGMWDEFDMVHGSKAHQDSEIDYPLSRRLSSCVYRRLLGLLFGLRVRDPQGSVFLKKSSVEWFLDWCDDDSGFFTTQLAIYAQLAGLSACEIPVVLQRDYTRRSRYSIVGDGWVFLKSALREYGRVRRFKSEEAVRAS
jgi:dolichyl-phosphate beta-glucosyltransferase